MSSRGTVDLYAYLRGDLDRGEGGLALSSSLKVSSGISAFAELQASAGWGDSRSLNYSGLLGMRGSW